MRTTSKTEVGSSSSFCSAAQRRESAAAAPAGASSSRPIISPTPRTSRIRSGCRACSARSPSRSWSPRAAAFSTRRSSASTSSVASAAAHATALPAYVPPSVPGSVRPAIAAVVETAESGRPEPMPLAITNTSGVTPLCSCAHIRPVRPTPHCTSSKMSSIPCASHRSRSP